MTCHRRCMRLPGRPPYFVASGCWVVRKMERREKSKAMMIMLRVVVVLLRPLVYRCRYASFPTRATVSSVPQSRHRRHFQSRPCWFQYRQQQNSHRGVHLLHHLVLHYKRCIQKEQQSRSPSRFGCRRRAHHFRHSQNSSSVHLYLPQGSVHRLDGPIVSVWIQSLSLIPGCPQANRTGRKDLRWLVFSCRHLCCVVDSQGIDCFLIRLNGIQEGRKERMKGGPVLSTLSLIATVLDTVVWERKRRRPIKCHEFSHTETLDDCFSVGLCVFLRLLRLPLLRLHVSFVSFSYLLYAKCNVAGNPYSA